MDGFEAGSVEPVSPLCYLIIGLAGYGLPNRRSASYVGVTVVLGRFHFTLERLGQDFRVIRCFGCIIEVLSLPVEHLEGDDLLGLIGRFGDGSRGLPPNDVAERDGKYECGQ